MANVWQSLAVVMLRTSSIDTVPATMTDVAAELDAADVERSREVAEKGCGVARDSLANALGTRCSVMVVPRSVEFDPGAGGLAARDQPAVGG
jgi:hypothetical protein